MRKVLVAGLLIGGMAFTSLAIADPTDVIEITSSAKKGGSKKKPKAIGPEFTMDTHGGPGERAENPRMISWWWDGIKQNSKRFPTCTAAEMDAAQSDSVCPTKAVIANGTILAQLGPIGQRASNVDCVKNVKFYNSGKNRFAWWAYGPAADCAGVAYLPPFEGTWTKEDGAARADTVLPDNIRQPLPGVEGGYRTLSLEYVKRTITKKKNGEKKKIGFLESTGCKGEREFSWERTTASNDDDIVTTVAGKC